MKTNEERERNHSRGGLAGFSGHGTRNCLTLLVTALVVLVAIPAGLASDRKQLNKIATKKYSRVVKAITKLKKPTEGAPISRLFDNKRLSTEERIEAINQLAARGAGLEDADDLHEVPLHRAIQLGEIETVGALITQGADLEVRGKKRETPLAAAYEAGDQEIFEALIEAGADLNVEARGDQSILTVVCANGDIDNASRLIDSGAAVNPDDQLTPLMGAAFSGNVALAKMLLDQHGADLDALHEGTGALTMAAAAGRPEMVRFLLDRGIDLSAQGPSALARAAEVGAKEVLEQLIGERGLDPDATVAGSVPAVLLAVRNRQDAAAAFLIDSGATMPDLEAETERVAADCLRLYGAGQLRAGNAEEGTELLAQAKGRYTDLMDKLVSRRRRLRRKKTFRFIGLALLQGAVAYAGAANARMQAKQTGQIGALRHAKVSGTGVNGYFSSVKSFERAAFRAQQGTAVMGQTAAGGLLSSGKGKAGTPALVGLDLEQIDESKAPLEERLAAVKVLIAQTEGSLERIASLEGNAGVSEASPELAAKAGEATEAPVSATITELVVDPE